MKTSRHLTLAVLFLGLIALEVGHGLFRIRSIQKEERRELVESVQRAHRALGETLGRSLRDGRENAAYLARTPSVRTLLQGEEAAARLRVEGDLLSYVVSFRGVDRVRLLDRDGRERFRCERMGKGVGSLPERSLEKEPDYGILRLVQAAEPGGVVVSDLSMDSRRVEVPIEDRKVIHFASAVDAPGGPLGYLVLTAYAEPFLKAVRTFAPRPGVTALLLDPGGAYLAHPDPARERGLPAAGHVSTDFPGLALPPAGPIEEPAAQGGMLLAEPLPGPTPPWTLVTLISGGALEQASEAASGEYLWILAGMAAITVILAAAGLFLVRMSLREVQLRESARYRKQEEELERRMRLSERLGSLGLLTAGVAHEINNPLEGIENYLALLDRDNTPPEKRKRYLEMVRYGFHRIRDIVRDLSSFARPGVESGTADLAEAINQALKMVSYTKELKGVEVELHGLETQILVPGDVRRLEQVFLNLFLNAGRAMAGSGTLRISASRTGDAAEEMVEVLVEDTGPGIPPEHLGRIFDPFFTTSGGTGLGLSISYGILTAHGGSLGAENRLEGGARFRLRLPVVRPTGALGRDKLNERTVT